MSDVVQIPVDMMRRIHEALSEAKDNTQDLQSWYFRAHGESTKKNRAMLEALTRDTEEIEELLKFTAENGGIL